MTRNEDYTADPQFQFAERISVFFIRLFHKTFISRKSREIEKSAEMLHFITRRINYRRICVSGIIWTPNLLSDFVTLLQLYGENRSYCIVQ